MTITEQSDTRNTTRRERLDARLRRVVGIHFDPDLGTPYWLDRQRSLGCDARRDIRSVDDLPILGEMTQTDLAERPLVDYIPRRFSDQMHRFIIGQTGGTTGPGVWTAYLENEFAEAFITPFEVAARHVGFPNREQWLFVGPSGPHIIGKVVRALANALGSADPFTIDLDPGWARRLAPGSFAHKRYLAHVTEQAMRIINAQNIGVLFTTPAVIESLAEEMAEHRRRAIRGIHLGGLRVRPEQLTRIHALFPRAVVLAGYGNTLMGCCLELDVSPSREHLDYYPFGDRLLLDVVDHRGDAKPVGEQGTVRLTRLDESFLIVNMRERDQAVRVAPKPGVPTGYTDAGLRNPHTPETPSARPTGGLY